jgi:hypothetical protein
LRARAVALQQIGGFQTRATDRLRTGGAPNMRAVIVTVCWCLLPLALKMKSCARR